MVILLSIELLLRVEGSKQSNASLAVVLDGARHLESLLGGGLFGFWLSCFFGSGIRLDIVSISICRALHLQVFRVIFALVNLNLFHFLVITFQAINDHLRIFELIRVAEIR